MSRTRSMGWLLVLVTLAAYLPALRNGFVNLDDPDYVTENPVVQQGLTLPGIQWAFGTWHASNWHPVTWLSHMADGTMFGLNPVGHHLTNILLHAANVWLLFILWFRLTHALWASAVVAALFGWHPLHVESVAWISERKDVLSTFFALLALLCYARQAKPESESSATPPAPLRSPYYWLALLCFALGLMAKPMLVTLPCVMVLLDLWPLRQNRPVWRLVLEKWPFLILTLVSCAITVLAQRAEAIAPLAKFSLALRLENVITAYARYLGNAVWPAHLAVFYPLLKPIPIAEVALSSAVLVAISLLAWRTAKTRPYLAFGWLWYLGTLVPVIGLVQVGDQALADRYTYFPLIGIFIALTWLAKDCAPHFRFPAFWAATAAAIVLVTCLAVTENQIRFWRDSTTLFTHSLSVTPDNVTARLNLGSAYQEQNHLPEAVEQYRAALRLDPACHEAYNNLGRLLNDAGKPAEALEYCRAAVKLAPRSPQSRLGLGIVLSGLTNFDGAIGEFAEAARLAPLSPAPHFQMGRTLLKQGHDVEAVQQLRQALQLAPDNLPMLIFTARVLAAHHNPQVRDGAGALALAQKAAQLSGGANPAVLDTLAMASAETAHFNDAIQFAQQALVAARTAGNEDDAAQIQERLSLFQRHQPARMSF